MTAQTASRRRLGSLFTFAGHNGGYGPDFAEDHVFGTHIGVDSHQNLQVRVKMPAPAGAHQDRIKEIHVATTAFA
ncbi:uncharacterized protein LOC142817436 isoform X3 [Rhipicephalus microplus]|uniref:uncharacterized protein LOC142817436 isoform X3 n=1 Tax=Rhipicephalus microplus TaxID=6941 RepID=UPI003F6BE9DC